MDASARRLPTPALVALALVLAAGTTLAHVAMVDLPNLAAQQAWHRAILAGRGFYPDQYRILSYALAEGLMRLGTPFIAAYEAQRLAFTAAAMVVLVRYLEAWLEPAYALAGLLLFAAVLPSTYFFYDLQPTDPLNMLVFFAAFLALQRGRDRWLPALTAIGALNRETVLLLPVLHVLVRAGREPARRWLPEAAASAVLAVAVYGALRLALGHHPPYAPTSFRHFWKVNLFERHTHLQLLLFWNVALLLAWVGLRRRPWFLRRALWLLPPFLAVHATVGYLRETRLLLPLVPVTLPLTLLALRDLLGRRRPRPAAA